MRRPCHILRNGITEWCLEGHWSPGEQVVQREHLAGIARAEIRVGPYLSAFVLGEAFAGARCVMLGSSASSYSTNLVGDHDVRGATRSNTGSHRQ